MTNISKSKGNNKEGKNGRPENRPQHGNHLTSLYWTKDWNKHMAIHNVNQVKQDTRHRC